MRSHPTLSTPRPAMSLLSLRGALAVALLALGAVAAPTAGAQTVGAAPAPVCDDVACTTVRFDIRNTTGRALTFNTLGLTASGPAYAFAADAGVGTFVAVDAFGPFGGVTTVGAGGTALFIDFLADAGFPFELGVGQAGYVEVELSAARRLGATAFAFTASFADGSAAAGPVSTVPEPTTVALLGGGLALLGGLGARRRRTR